MARLNSTPPRYPAFARRFRELILGETQEAVAQRLDCSQSYVGQFARGVSRPSYNLAERIIETYRLPRDEWLELMGHGKEADPEDEREEIARRAAELALTHFQISTNPATATELVTRLADRVREHPEELTYESVDDGENPQWYGGPVGVRAEDLDVIAEIVDRARRAARARQGRESG